MKKILVLVLSLLLLSSCANNQSAEITLDAPEANMLMYTDLNNQEKIGMFLKMDGDLLTKKCENNDTFLLFVGHPNCAWCQKGISVVNDLILNNNVYIYYLNPKFVAVETIDYLKEICADILKEQNETTIKVPAVIAVKDGKVVSLMAGGIASEGVDYTQEERKKLLDEYQNLLNNIPTEKIKYDSNLIPIREKSEGAVFSHDEAVTVNLDIFETYKAYGKGTMFIANQEGPYILYRTLFKDPNIGYYSRYIDEYILYVDDKNKEAFIKNKDNINQLLMDMYNEANPDLSANEDYFNSLKTELIENSDGSVDLYVEEQYNIDYLRTYDKSFSTWSIEETIQKIVDTHKLIEHCDSEGSCIYYNLDSGEYCYPDGLYCVLVDNNGMGRKYYFDYTPYELAIQNTDYNWELYETNNQ